MYLIIDYLYLKYSHHRFIKELHIENTDMTKNIYIGSNT